MTEAELDAVAARAQAATPGPWAAEESKYDYRIIEAESWTVAKVFEWRESIYQDAPPERLGEGLANAAFIAAARQDVPALLAEVQRLRAGLADLRIEHAIGREEGCVGWCDCGAADHNARIAALLGEAAP